MTLSLTYKGFNYPAFYNGAYTDANSLGSLASTGANAVSVGLDYGIDAATSTVYADADVTDSLTDLSNTILQAESLGLSVMVRPLIDLVNETLDGTLTGDWRDTYEPANPAAFFSSYEKMIVSVASIAQADGAPILDIGTELDQLTGPKYLSQWTQIIAAVRAVYSGELTYSADWDDDISPWTYSGAPAGTGNIATQISFWNQLNFLGIDQYATISDATNPTLQQLIDGWTQPPTDPTTAAVTGGQSLISYYESISAEIGKPLLFTEMGYPDAADAAAKVVASTSTVVDQALQSSLYTAFFDAWEQSGNDALKGTYFWYWNPDSASEGPNNGITFSPQGLLAQTAITNAYSSYATTTGTVPCYVAGTRLATQYGQTAVEALRPGDLVRTHAGQLRPIIWIGQRRYDGANIRGNADLLPILITAHGLAEGTPARDLLVSPDHALLLDGVLVPARYLVNGASIRQVGSVDAVEYFHVELETHDILLAEGAPAESYLDTGNRARFANGVERLASHKAEAKDWSGACAELVLAGPRLVAIKQRLFARGAHPRPIRQTLQVSVGEGLARRKLPPASQVLDQWSFQIPSGEAFIDLVSEPFIPATCLPDSLDQRRLGVRLSAIGIDGGELPLGTWICHEGFYPVELTGEGACRWTNGAARLALPHGARRLVLRLTDPVEPLG